VAEGMPHRITQRGNRRRKTFFLMRTMLPILIWWHMGNVSFMSYLEQLLGRKLRPLKPWRKTKKER